MTSLTSFDAQLLPEGFDLNGHGEKPIIDISIQANEIHLSYIFPAFRMAAHSADPIGDSNEFHQEVGISGTGFLSESGKPLLPSFGRFLQIPPGYDFTYAVKETASRAFTDYKIKPAQETASDQNAWTVDEEELPYDKTDAFYPQKLVEISPPLYLDGYRVLCIHVRPMQYNPAQKVLKCYGNIEVTISFSQTAKQEDPCDIDEMPPWVYLDRNINLEGFGNLLFNPERKYFEKRGWDASKMLPAKSRPDAPNYLIIYGKSFEKAVGKLQTWKQKCGLNTAMVPVAAILGAEDGQQTKAAKVEKIKTYIREKRREPLSPLRYVLLFGDIHEIPTEERKLPGPSSSTQKDTTDYYYFTHRDAREEECLLPWVAGGRIAAAGAEDGLAIVDQIIRYEKDPPDDPDYFRRMTVSALFEDCDAGGQQDGRANRSYMKTMETIRDHMMSYGFEVNRVYVSNNRAPERYSDGTPVPATVKAELIYTGDGPVATKKLIGLINEGQLIIGHRGHGDFLGWKDPRLKTKDLDKVSTTCPSVFFSINCRTGSFDSNRTCFAESILALNGAAPTIIAATELSGAWRNDSMIKALYDAVWPGVIPTYPITTMRFPVKYYRMGDIMNYAKAYLLVAHGDNPNTQKHFEIYHVIGDPTLHIWGSIPETLRLRARVREDILVINMNTNPQEAVLSIWYEGNCLLSIEPACSRLAVPLRILEQLPEDTLNSKRDHAYQLSLYYSAPGHRMAEAHLWL